MLKIKTLTVENFRGIRQAFPLDFEKQNILTSVVVYGRNGTGKSSFVDGWEWLLRSRIGHLSKEGVTPSDYPHRASKGVNSRVCAEFSHEVIKSVSRKFDNQRVQTPVVEGEHSTLIEKTRYPNYLRASDLHSFVYLTKTEKYKYVAEFFGLDDYTVKQSQLKTASWRVREMLRRSDAELKRNNALLRGLVGKGKPDETDIVARLNQIATKHAIPEVALFEDFDRVKEALKLLIEKSPSAKLLTEWKAFNGRPKNYFPIGDAKLAATDLENSFRTLKANETNTTRLFLNQLYESAELVLDRPDVGPNCPLCDKTFEGDLREHIQRKHASLDALQKAKAEFDLKKQQFEDLILSVKSRTDTILGENSQAIRKEFAEFFEKNVNIANDLILLTAEVNKPVTEISKLEIRDNEIVKMVDEIRLGEAKMLETVASQITTLAKDKTTESLVQDFELIVKLVTAHISCLVREEEIKYLDGITTDLASVYKKLTSYIESEIQGTFKAIEGDVMEYFDVLEGTSAHFRNPKIKFIDGKEKAVELEIEFANETVRPAFKFMSESQVNSFGLSIFLAAVKHFNQEFRFLVLDDIVSSFDDYKRPKLTHLLKSKFDSFQILLLTHDLVFFETVLHAFPGWQRYKVEAWDFNTGPRFRLARNYLERVQDSLDQDDPIAAGQGLGRYLERTFGTLNERLKGSLPYRRENLYTLTEHYEPMRKKFKKVLNRSNETHRLNLLFAEFDQGEIFRNFCMHWKDEASPFGTPEIQTIFDVWLEIEKLVFCGKCATFVKLNDAINPATIRCDCSELNISADSMYVKLSTGR